MTKRNIPQIQPGDKFGRLTIIARAGATKNGTILWECECSCADKTRTKVPTSTLRRKTQPTRSCGCLARELAAERGRNRPESAQQPQVGGKVGRWLVVSDTQTRDAEGSRLYQCKCSCKDKTERLVSAHKLTRAKKRSNSCGCLQKETAVKTHTTHGKSGTQAWHTAHQAQRRATKLNAIPRWHRKETKACVKALTEEAKRLEAETGVRYHVDHIVPLRGRIANAAAVCGLHVKANLQLLTEHDNRVKNCRVWPSMP